MLKANAKLKRVSLYIAVLLCAATAAMLYKHEQQSRQPTGRAKTLFDQAQKPLTAVTRQSALKEALLLWLQQQPSGQQRAVSDAATAKLIADSYFQLQQYAWALLYYKRAQILTPRDPALAHAIKDTSSALGISTSKPALFTWLFMPLPFFLSAAEQLALLLLFALFSTACYVALLLQKQKQWRVATLFWLAVAAWIGMQSLYERYFVAAEAVVITPSEMYTQANTDAAMVAEALVMPGDLVYVMDISSDGQWLAIKNGRHQLGYVHYSHVRLI